MTTPDEEAKHRKEQAEQRMKAAGHLRTVGSSMMVAGGVVFFGASAAFAFAESHEIESWVRQLVFTLVGMLWLGGTAFYAVGQSEERRLAQAADDRAEREAQHEGLMAEIRQIKRNQTFLIARPGGEGAVATYRVREDPVPSVDTLDMVEMVRQLRREQAAVAAPVEKPNFNGHHDDPVDPKYLADMSEAVELGKEIQRRKNQPPNPSS